MHKAQNTIAGRRGELLIQSLLLGEPEIEVYTPLCDNDGVDLVVRKARENIFLPLQIKGRVIRIDSPQKDLRFKVSKQTLEAQKAIVFVLVTLPSLSDDIGRAWTLHRTEFDRFLRCNGSLDLRYPDLKNIDSNLNTFCSRILSYFELERLA